VKDRDSFNTEDALQDGSKRQNMADNELCTVGMTRGRRELLVVLRCDRHGWGLWSFNQGSELGSM
jgi:hypothetical protein